MWTPATRSINFSGSAMVSLGGAAPPVPLPGVLVEPLLFTLDGAGNATFEALEFTERTAGAPDVGVGPGDFEFQNLPVTVEVQTVSSSIPPYDEYEITRPDSLPNLAFRLFVEAEVLAADATPTGTQFADVFDERSVVGEAWTVIHPERLNVPLTGSAAFLVLAEDSEAALQLVAQAGVAPVVAGREFHFLRVGRAIRQEIGELGDARLDYAGKSGYFTSSNVWTGDPPEPSFFPGQVDAPFGRTLQIGGHFGADFHALPLAEELYYHVDFSRYTGSLANPYNAGDRIDTTPVLDPLFNKKYLLPTVALPKGKWQTLHLGPFEGTITAVEPPHAPALIGTHPMVFKRPAPADPLTEYWPFHDLMVIWNSAAAANELAVLTIEIYRKTGGTDAAPELTKLAMDASINDHLPLLIDNRLPVLKIFDWRTGYATFATETVNPLTIAPLDPCGSMPVTPGQVGGNECLLVKYSIEDGAGNPHPHVKSYGMGVEYSPRQVAGAPLSAGLDLWGGGGHPPFGDPGYQDINGNYSPAVPPVYEVSNYDSVLLPWQADAWPPEPNGDPPSPCTAYAAEVSLGCGVRTVNGWSRAFSHRHVSRHIIIKR